MAILCYTGNTLLYMNYHALFVMFYKDNDNQIKKYLILQQLLQVSDQAEKTPHLYPLCTESEFYEANLMSTTLGLGTRYKDIPLGNELGFRMSFL